MIVCDFCGREPVDAGAIVSISPPSEVPTQVTLCTPCAVELAQTFRARKNNIRGNYGQSKKGDRGYESLRQERLGSLESSSVAAEIGDAEARIRKE